MRWIICFNKSRNAGIWNLFTLNHPEMSHVFAVRYDIDAGVWMKLEFASEKFNFEVYTNDEATDLIATLMEECICIRVHSKANPIALPRLGYCVSFVKHIIGLRKFWVITPYQLYCELRKQKNPIIFNKTMSEV